MAVAESETGRRSARKRRRPRPEVIAAHRAPADGEQGEVSEGEGPVAEPEEGGPAEAEDSAGDGKGES